MGKFAAVVTREVRAGSCSRASAAAAAVSLKRLTVVESATRTSPAIAPSTLSPKPASPPKSAPAPGTPVTGYVVVNGQLVAVPGVKK